MYISQQRKKFESCLALQHLVRTSRKNNKLVSKLKRNTHIKAMYKLCTNFNVLLLTMPLRMDIVESILGTPIQLLVSSHPNNYHVEQFPDRLFHQLRSLKKHNARARRAKQKMNSLNWQTSVRPNRPFEDPPANFGCAHYQPPSNNYKYTPPPPSAPPLSSTPPPFSIPRPPASRSKLHGLTEKGQLVTDYYRDQAKFYQYDEATIGPDPFATEPEEPQPGPLQVFVLSVFAIITNIIAYYKLDPLLAASHAIVLWCLGTMQNVWYWAGRVKSGVCVAVLVAIPIALHLPLPERPAGPVYTIRVADGNGHVMPGDY